MQGFLPLSLGPMGRLRNKVEQECRDFYRYRSALWDACVV
jgi:hypothetical protein